MKENKARISLSIRPELVKMLDREVDGIRNLSRSEAVERIIEQHVTSKKTCVILAGGPAKNLAVESSYRPLVPMGNGQTLIEAMVDKVRKAGYHNIIIIGSKQVLSEVYRVLGEAGVTYLEEKKAQGTAKTFQQAQEYVKNTFLFFPCDHYIDIDFQQMEEYHKQHKGLMTLAVYAGTKYAWDKSSIVELEGNRITSYEERPKKNKSHLTSLFVGFAEPEAFSLIPSSNLTYSLQEDVFPELAKQGQLYGYLFSGTWKNIHEKKDTTGLLH